MTTKELRKELIQIYPRKEKFCSYYCNFITRETVFDTGSTLRNIYRCGLKNEENKELIEYQATFKNDRDFGSYIYRCQQCLDLFKDN